MLIAISGSQGSGKTTLLNKIKELGHTIVERKTSRSIMTEWNVDLNTINNDPEWTLKFQEEILRRKYLDELDASMKTRGSVFTERTYADLMTYFLVALGKVNGYSKAINEYYKSCIKQQMAYDKVFYLKAGHFVPEDDGVRGANVHYSRMIDLTMLDLTQQMTPSHKLTIIDTPCMEQRLNIILAHSGV